MGYDESPAIERMLIEHIITAWIRLQQMEWRNLNHALGEHERRDGHYWKARLSAGPGALFTSGGDAGTGAPAECENPSECRLTTSCHRVSRKSPTLVIIHQQESRA